MIQHTNGPWRVAYSSRCIVAGSSSETVAVVAGEERDRIGNARAISAVPELIAALRKMMTAGYPDTPAHTAALDNARRALQKAGL